MEALLELSAESLTPILERLGDRPRQFDDALLPGVPLRVRLEVVAGKLVVDFDGTAPVQQYGWNATPAIVSAAVLYVLRCLSDHPLPLNEGALRRLELRLPGGLLNPPAAVVPTNSPAVVAGNVETSQRIVDCLLGALGVAAASQGTMNNLLLGNERFGYYETICGGSGATAEGAGASAVHTHMTNTRITDAEILESRYPLRLWQFRIRTGSGGEGQYRGGDGVIRELEALAPLTATLLTSRRDPPPPFGSTGGAPGACGRNWLLRDGQRPRELPASTSLQLAAGDRLRLETPGGGGYGKAGE
jgi:5-oxoprolinase (ATP-hydrolysing)